MKVVKHYSEFLDRINGSNIVCFGAGKRLDRFVDILPKECIYRVTHVIDNSIDKQNTRVQMGEREIIIENPQTLFQAFDKQTIVVITCIEYEGILNQLENCLKSQDIEVYILSFLLADYYDEKAMNKVIPDNLSLSKKREIPKVIHYCWFGGNPIPTKYKEWMSSWKKYCPDYDIVEWNETNYDYKKNKYMMQAYECKKWGFVPDFARLDIIYQYGGIYLDTDVEIVKNFDDLLYQKGFAGFESDQYVALGLGFGAAPGNTIIQGFMEQYEQMQFVDKNGNIDMTPSPIYQTEYLKKLGLVQNGEYQVIDGKLTIYPEKVLCGKNVFSRRIRLKEYTHSIHHYDGSWMEQGKKAAIVKLEKCINS